MEHYTYLLVEFCTLVVPFVFTFHPKLRFDKQLQNAGLALIVSALFFIAWDFWYTYWNVWGFNERKVSGIFIGNLPLEEVLFFLIIPYACLFTYHCLKPFLKSAVFIVLTPLVLVVLQLILLGGIVFYYDRLYTLGTCIALLLVLPPIPLKRCPPYMPAFLVSWLIMLLPFFIVNGILTGTGLDAPVVWYNDAENLGLRLGTIPVEDVFYGMALILLNVRIYEWLKTR